MDTFSSISTLRHHGMAYGCTDSSSLYVTWIPGEDYPSKVNVGLELVRLPSPVEPTPPAAH